MRRSIRVKQEPDVETVQEVNDAEMSANSDEEDDDEVVREIDVFLSPSLASQLHLIQFPLQHRPVPPPEQARIRPHHGILEIDQRIPANIGHEGGQAGYLLPHRTHVSTTIPISTHMALGKFEYTAGNNVAALHLIPLLHTTQMRPSFAHVDDAGGTAGTDVLALGSEPDEATDETVTAKLERKPLMFHKKESERATIARKSTFAYKKASEEAEDWRELTVQDAQSPGYQQIRPRISCTTPQNELLEKIDEKNHFVCSLNYLPERQRVVEIPSELDASTGTALPTHSTLTQISVQLTKLLQHGWPVPYGVLKAQFSSSVDELDLLTALSSCAVLVRGNFVLQSRLSKLPAEMAQARTFILYILQTLGYVQRSRLEHVYAANGTVSSEALLLLLEQVAVKTMNGWQLKLPDNLAFCDQFPEQVQLYSQYWERQASHFEKNFKLYSMDATSV